MDEIGVAKHYTIIEAKNEIKKLENDLDRYLTQRKINYLKTQPKSIDYSKILVDCSHANFDCFLNYQIKNEDYDTKVYGLVASILSWQKYIAEELYRMSKYDEISYIRYLKDEEKLSWKEIDRKLNYAEGTCRQKYYRFSIKN